MIVVQKYVVIIKSSNSNILKKSIYISSCMVSIKSLGSLIVVPCIHLIKFYSATTENVCTVVCLYAVPGRNTACSGHWLGASGNA